MGKLLILTFLMVLSLALKSGADEIRVITKPHPLDVYALELLQIVLKNMDGNYTIDNTRIEYTTRRRMISKVQKGEIDLWWMAADESTESVLLPVRFPLLKGLLGYRICIIRSETQEKFNHISTYDDLKQLVYGQGVAWPDTRILRHNGFEVVTSSKYPGLFHMLDGSRFDAFPRGVLEPWLEVAARPELDLTVENRIAFMYRMPFYFFLTPGNHKLANAIQAGLEKSLANGDFDKFYYNNTLIKDALTRANLKNRAIFKLDNPTLTKETPLERSDYWLNIEGL